MLKTILLYLIATIIILGPALSFGQVAEEPEFGGEGYEIEQEVPLKKKKVQPAQPEMPVMVQEPVEQKPLEQPIVKKTVAPKVIVEEKKQELPQQKVKPEQADTQPTPGAQLNIVVDRSADVQFLVAWSSDGSYFDAYHVSTGRQLEQFVCTDTGALTKKETTLRNRIHPIKLDEHYQSSSYGEVDETGVVVDGANMDNAIGLGNGEFLHAALTSNSKYLGWRDSGGCIRQPIAQSKKLFRQVEKHGMENTWITIMDSSVDGTTIYMHIDDSSVRKRLEIPERTNKAPSWKLGVVGQKYGNQGNIQCLTEAQVGLYYPELGLGGGSNADIQGGGSNDDFMTIDGVTYKRGSFGGWKPVNEPEQVKRKKRSFWKKFKNFFEDDEDGSEIKIDDSYDQQPSKKEKKKKKTREEKCAEKRARGEKCYLF